MTIKKHIPNTLTLGNLFCGCLALVQAFNGNLVWAACFVGISLVLDFFDGFAARALKVSSPIGKDLDSLADMVTFGVVPGVVMFQLINISIVFCFFPENEAGSINFSILERWKFYFETYQAIRMNPPLVETGSPVWVLNALPYFGFIITLFSCIRLAKFNNDTRQTNSFIGLPTPANTMVICSLPLILQFQPGAKLAADLIINPWFLIVLSAVMSILLIAEIPLFALKFRNFSWQTNKLVYSFLMLAVVLLFILKFIAIPLVIFLYILISIVNNIFLKNKV